MSRRRRVPEVLRRWGQTIFQTGAVAIYGPIFIAQVISAPSVWHWSLVIVWALLAIGLPFTIRSTWRHRHEPMGRGILAPSTIPLTDIDESVVREAIDRNDSRVLAVKAVREAYPGLGLRDAADVVDRHRHA